MGKENGHLNRKNLTKGNIFMIRNMDRVNLNGRTAASIKDSFRMINSNFCLILRNGYGKLTYQNGRVIKGIWK